jgi:hypothetical protein
MKRKRFYKKVYEKKNEEIESLMNNLQAINLKNIALKRLIKFDS